MGGAVPSSRAVVGYFNITVSGLTKGTTYYLQRSFNLEVNWVIAVVNLATLLDASQAFYEFID